MSYHYRETYAGEDYRQGRTVGTGDLKQTLNLDKHSPDLVLVADAFSDPKRGIQSGHIDGYNFARLDSSGEYYQDPEQKIDKFNGTRAWNTSQWLVERAFESFRWGELVGRDLYKP